MNGEQLRRLPWELTHRRGAMLASRVREQIVRATHLHCTVRFEDPVYLGPGFRLDIPQNGTLIVARHTQFRLGFYCEISGDGTVTVGEGCAFTYYCHVACTTSISIGNRCTIAKSALIVDGSHRFRDLDIPMLQQGYDYRPITIGDDALIHANCTVINDVGERSVIAANAVVTKPIPAYCVAAGVPARVIEYFGPPEQCPPGLEHLIVRGRGNGFEAVG